MNSSTRALATPPVLVIGYRRPDLIAEVMQAVSEARPRRLFLACDGPHPDRPGEVALVAATRAAMETAVTWDCEVRSRYADTNQGCRRGVQQAISWFFSEVEEGIILEDDCVPHRDFFPYCAELLDRYRDDDRVMHVSGDGALQHPGANSETSYVFSHQPLVWGWATWRRAWDHYDAELHQWAQLRTDAAAVRRTFGSRAAADWWSRVLDGLLHDGKPDTWDYQWTFSIMARQGIAIIPAVNLVTNTGFRDDATHTTNVKAPRANAVTESLLPLNHPASVRVDRRSDARFQQQLHGYRPSPAARSIRQLRKRYRRGLKWIARQRHGLERLSSHGHDA